MSYLYLDFDTINSPSYLTIKSVIFPAETAGESIFCRKLNLVIIVRQPQFSDI